MKKLLLLSIFIASSLLICSCFNNDKSTTASNEPVKIQTGYSGGGYTSPRIGGGGSGSGFPLTNNVDAGGFTISNITIEANIVRVTNALISASVLEWRPIGTADVAFLYYSNQLVTHDGSLYAAARDIIATNFGPINPACGGGPFVNDCVWPVPGVLHTLGGGDDEYFFKRIAKEGPQGAQGPQGTAGIDGTNGVNGVDGQDGFGNGYIFGQWDPSKEYVTNTLISYDNNSYFSLLNNTNENPSTQTNYWELWLEGGTQGTNQFASNLVFRGDYLSVTPYVSNDVVTYQGSIFYKWTNAVSTNIAPLLDADSIGINSDHWQIYNTRGLRGLTGATGPAGTDGLDGAVTEYNTYYTILTNAGPLHIQTNGADNTHRIFQFTKTIGGTNYYSWLPYVFLNGSNILEDAGNGKIKYNNITISTNSALGDESNVSIVSPSNGDALVYNGSEWTNKVLNSGATNYTFTQTQSTNNQITFVSNSTDNAQAYFNITLTNAPVFRAQAFYTSSTVPNTTPVESFTVGTAGQFNEILMGTIYLTTTNTDLNGTFDEATPSYLNFYSHSDLKRSNILFKAAIDLQILDNLGGSNVLAGDVSIFVGANTNEYLESDYLFLSSTNQSYAGEFVQVIAIQDGALQLVQPGVTRSAGYTTNEMYISRAITFAGFEIYDKEGGTNMNGQVEFAGTTPVSAQIDFELKSE